MADDAVQQERLLQIVTPLGPDVLLPINFSGQEGISQSFHFRLELVSTLPEIKPEKILGQKVTIKLRLQDDDFRFFNGYITRFYAGENDIGGFRHYHAEVRPWIWFLTRTADCRIYQQKKIEDILKEIFQDCGFNDHEFKLKGQHKPWEYCVQYRETDFNFISRLMEEEGMYYWFKHEETKHVLFVTDDKSEYFNLDNDDKEAIYTPGSRTRDTIYSWQHEYKYIPGKWTQRDYCFETPTANLEASAPAVVQPTDKKYEIFDYPGGYATKADGQVLTKLRMEEEEAGFHEIQAASTYRTYTPGAKFKIISHPIQQEQKKEYVITSIEHAAADDSYITRTGGASQSYNNSFTCISSDVSFRPPLITLKPVVQGPQTAVVVGPQGEEIYTDKYGRVKVQFHWDRKGKKNENSSCWLRVSQPWAGRNWGAMFLPRIGHEVIVDFLEGNPDKPIIIGRVYNDDNMPPYELPANKTQSGVKSRSTPKGEPANFNELRFEDKKGNEEIYMHAEKDLTTIVENHEERKVYVDRKTVIGTGDNPRPDETIEEKLIWGTRIENVKGDDGLVVRDGANGRKVVIGDGDHILEVEKGNQSTNIALGKGETEAMQSIELKVGQNSLKIDQMGITITGINVTIEGKMNVRIQGGIQVNVNGGALTTIKGGLVQIN